MLSGVSQTLTPPPAELIDPNGSGWIRLTQSVEDAVLVAGSHHRDRAVRKQPRARIESRFLPAWPGTWYPPSRVNVPSASFTIAVESFVDAPLSSPVVMNAEPSGATAADVYTLAPLTVGVPDV